MTGWGDGFRNAFKPIREAKPRTIILWAIGLSVYIWGMLAFRWMRDSAAW